MEEQAQERETYDTLLDFFKALGSVERLKIAGRLAQGPATAVELARALEMGERDAAHHLARLEASGLARVVLPETQAYGLDEEALLRMKKEVFASGRPKHARSGERGWRERLFDTFVQDGRLIGIPAQHKRRVAIVGWLARRFEPDVRYSEQEVNERISDVYHDYASLRRYMVDYGFMERDHGVYWRVSEVGAPAQEAV
jgi:hypothetical protein